MGHFGPNCKSIGFRQIQSTPHPTGLPIPFPQRRASMGMETTKALILILVTRIFIFEPNERPAIKERHFLEIDFDDHYPA
jgi:hypothetical protein